MSSILQGFEYDIFISYRQKDNEYDTGVLHFLHDIPSFQELKNNVLIGASWEGHVIEQIRRKARDRFQYFYYRTHQGTECDLVLVRSGKVAAAIEIKYSLAPVLNKGFHVAVDDLKSEKNFVLIPMGESFQISTKIKVASLPDFLTNDLPKL